MPDIFAPIRETVAIRVSERHKVPIAIVGAGEIADLAHLPAYAAHGLKVVGIHDLDKVKAKAVAERHGLSRVYDSVDEIARDRDVAVVDIAVFPWVQCGIAAPLLDAGKHLLCQKPISYDFDEAVRLVKHAEKCKRLMAVNQQLRFSESVAATRAMVKAGWSREMLAHLSRLIDPAGEPALPPSRIVSVLGRTDRWVPFDDGSAMVRQWRLPEANIFSYQLGHLGMPMQLMRNAAPFERLRQVLLSD